jgi:hypothetical protein
MRTTTIRTGRPSLFNGAVAASGIALAPFGLDPSTIHVATFDNVVAMTRRDYRTRREAEQDTRRAG